MENSSSFNKLTRHLDISYPILDKYNSVSGLIFRSSQKDSFSISLFFGYLQEIFRKQALHKLRSFISVFEYHFLPFYKEFDHEYKEPFMDSSLSLLKKIDKLSKFDPELAIQKLESIKGKPEELAFIVKVALFGFLYKLRKIETNKKIKKKLKKKLKFLLQNQEELRDSKSNRLFFSSVFKVNLLFFCEENPKNDPEHYFFDKKDKNTLKVAFLEDEDEGIRILSREDVTYQEDKDKLLVAARNSLLLTQELVKSNQNTSKMQIKYKNLLKAYTKARRIPELLLESLDNFTEAVILLKEDLENPQEFKFSNYSMLVSTLKTLKKYENLAKIQINDDDGEDSITAIQESIMHVSAKINGIFKQEGEKSGEDDSDDNLSDIKSLDQDHERVLEFENVANSNKLQEINNSLQNNLLEMQQNKKKMKNFNEESKIFEENEEIIIENIDDIIKDEEIKPGFECPICLEEVTLDQVFSLNCSPKAIEEEEVSMDQDIALECPHKACQKCITHFLLERYNNGQWEFEIQCFSCDKVMKWTESIKVWNRLIGKERVDKMSVKAAWDLTTNQCAGCKYPFILQEDNQIQNFICDICNAETCLKCGELKHEEKFCQKIMKEMQIALNDERMRCCPNCMEIYLKDDHCEHVTCLKCKLDFCYNCSAPREPILGHGGHFHRRGCKYFFRLMDVETKKEMLEDEFSEKCKECKKNMKVCKRPEKDLKTFYEPLGLILENEENPHDIDIE